MLHFIQLKNSIYYQALFTSRNSIIKKNKTNVLTKAMRDLARRVFWQDAPATVILGMMVNVEDDEEETETSAKERQPERAVDDGSTGQSWCLPVTKLSTLGKSAWRDKETGDTSL